MMKEPRPGWVCVTKVEEALVKAARPFVTSKKADLLKHAASFNICSC